MSYEERMQAVEQFEARGGILLVTDAAFAEGIDVSFVDECIHYDLPYDPRRLEQRVGRFLQRGRKKQSFRSISIHASERGLAWEDHLFRQLAKKASTLIDELGEQDLDDLLRAMLEDG